MSNQPFALLLKPLPIWDPPTTTATPQQADSIGDNQDLLQKETPERDALAARRSTVVAKNALADSLRPSRAATQLRRLSHSLSFAPCTSVHPPRRTSWRGCDITCVAHRWCCCKNPAVHLAFQADSPCLGDPSPDGQDDLYQQQQQDGGGCGIAFFLRSDLRLPPERRPRWLDFGTKNPPPPPPLWAKTLPYANLGGKEGESWGWMWVWEPKRRCSLGLLCAFVVLPSSPFREALSQRVGRGKVKRERWWQTEWWWARAAGICQKWGEDFCNGTWTMYSLFLPYSRTETRQTGETRPEFTGPMEERGLNSSNGGALVTTKARSELGSVRLPLSLWV